MFDKFVASARSDISRDLSAADKNNFPLFEPCAPSHIIIRGKRLDTTSLEKSILLHDITVIDGT